MPGFVLCRTVSLGLRVREEVSFADIIAIADVRCKDVVCCKEEVVVRGDVVYC